VIKGYYRQVLAIQGELGIEQPVRLDALLLLPGALQERERNSLDVDQHWTVIEAALRAALTGLREMRFAEGQAMAAELHTHCEEMGRLADQIAARAPHVAESYQQRLTEKLNGLLTQHGMHVQPGDVVREVGIFADRADVSEEIVRLRSHVQQFDAATRREDGAGRRLDFLVQELLREANTIGSKANDATISQLVVQMKTCIERMREMVQNIE
jgi:uncharacterized protein (TIGR00255 family)